MHHDNEQHEDDGGEEAAEGRASLSPQCIVHGLGLGSLPLFIEELGMGGEDHGSTGACGCNLELASDGVLDEKHGHAGRSLGWAGGLRRRNDKAAGVVLVADLTSKSVGSLLANPALDAGMVSELLRSSASTWRDEVGRCVLLQAYSAEGYL